MGVGDDGGMHTVADDDTVAVGLWQRLLDDPERILNILDDDNDT